VARRVSRREVLRRSAAAGVAAVATPAATLAQIAPESTAVVPQTLEPDAFATLEAIVSRLIPRDANGPGALEAGAASYIDRALDNALSDYLERYRLGLEAIDARARSTSGAPFTALDAAAQDALLLELENPPPGSGERADLANFLDLVIGHTIEGTFCDPRYGGNRDFIGWDMIGYPGLRLAVGPAEQRMDSLPEDVRVSAYDLPMFAALDPDREFDDG